MKKGRISRRMLQAVQKILECRVKLLVIDRIKKLREMVTRKRDVYVDFLENRCVDSKEECRRVIVKQTRI